MLKKIVLVLLLLVALFIFLYPQTSTWTAADQSGSGSADAGEPDLNWRNQIRAASISTGGNQIRIKIFAHSTQDLVIGGSSIGEQSGVNAEDFAAAPTRITWDTGNSGNTVTAGGNEWSDWISFDLDETKSYLIHFWRGAAGTFYCKSWNDQANSTYYNAGATDWTMTVDWTATGYTNLMAVGEIEVQTVGEEENAIFFGINFLAMLLFIGVKEKVRK